MPQLTDLKQCEFYLRIIWKSNSINCKERVYVIFLNDDGRALDRKSICKGKYTECLIDEREIVYEALKLHCNKIILAHNHPGGNCYPSEADIAATRKLNDILSALHITLHDHVILTDKELYSFRDQGLIQEVKLAG